MLVVMNTFSFAFYLIRLENVNTGLPPLFRLGLMAFLVALWHPLLVCYEEFAQQYAVSPTPQIFDVAVIVVSCAFFGAYFPFGLIVGEIGVTHAG